MPPNERYALVTGCSEGGMGWSVAREFARRGIHTFATLRTVSRAAELATTANVTVLPLDITSEESVAACVAEVVRRTGGRLDFLYNNAGAQNVMPLADQDLAAARRFWDTNFWGALLVTQKLLPLLIEARGYIAMAASVRSKVPGEFDGLYGASKAALTAMTDNLRCELEPLGVRVVCVQIGAVGTRVFSKHRGAAGEGEPLQLPEDSYYKPIEAQIQKLAGGSRLQQLKLMARDDFARNTVGDMLNGKTGTIWRGSYATTTQMILQFMPQWLLERIAYKPDNGLGELKLAREAGSKPA